MPDFSQNLRKGEVIFNLSGPILAIKWCDKRDVHILSTMHEISITTTAKLDKKQKKIFRNLLQ